MHPNLKYYLFNDDEIDVFFEENFTPMFLNMERSFKAGVMTADMWRMVFAYLNGGIYADIDVKPLKRFDKWEFYPFKDI